MLPNPLTQAEAALFRHKFAQKFAFAAALLLSYGTDSTYEEEDTYFPVSSLAALSLSTGGYASSYECVPLLLMCSAVTQLRDRFPVRTRYNAFRCLSMPLESGERVSVSASG